MTSAKLFFNLLGNTFKRRMGVFLISVLAFFLYVLAQLTERTVYQTEVVRFGLQNQNLLFLTVGLAVLCAYQGFGYLFSAKTTDFYYSLPVRKSLLFLVNYIHGLLLFIIPFAVTQVICMMAFGGSGGGSTAGLFTYTGYGMLVVPLIFSGAYHFAILAIMLTGNAAVSAGILAMLVFYVKIWLDQILLPYCEFFFHTFYRIDCVQEMQAYVDPLQIIQSVMYGKANTNESGYYYAVEVMPLLILLTGVLISFCLTAVLAGKRKAECAGRAVAFDWMKPVLRAAIGIPAALLSGYFVMNVTGGQLAAGIAGVVPTIAAVHLLLELLFHFRFQKVSLHSIQAVAGVAFSIGILCLFYLGKDTYDQYMPKLEQLEAVAITIDGLDYGPGEEKQDTFWGGGMVERTRLENLRLKGASMEAGYRWLQETRCIPSDEKSYTTDTVAYYKKDGSIVYRKYAVQTKEALSDFDEIYTSPEYKHGLYTILEVEDTGRYAFIWSNGVEKRTLSLTEEEKAGLLSAYKEELYALTLEDIERSLPIGMLMLEDAASGDSTNGYIYPEFVNTIQKLAEKKIPTDKSIADYTIVRIDQEYVDNQTKRVYKKEVVEEGTKIEKISAGLIYEGYAIQPLLKPVDRSCKMRVHFKNPETLEESELNCYELADPEK